MKKILLKILIIALAICGILGISIVILDLWNSVTIRVLFTTLFIFLFSIPSLCCSSLYEKKQKRIYSLIGLCICLFSCIYALMLLWRIIPFEIWDTIHWKLIASSVILSISAGHLCLVAAIDSNDKSVNLIQKLTILFSIIIDIFFLTLIYTEFELPFQVLVILGIIIALGTIIVPILNKTTNYSKNTILSDDKYKKISELKSLLDNKAISLEEYEVEKNKILNQ